MDTVMVYTFKNSTLLSSPTPVQRLSGQQLERLGSLSVADATRFLSGIQLKDYGGIGGLKTINVRSMGANHTTVYLDGLPISNAQNGQVDLGKFALDNIAKISLYSGDRPLLLQPAKAYASASSIYLESQLPAMENGQKQSLKAVLKTGSFGLFNPSLQWQKQLSTRTTASLSTAYTQANGRYRFRIYDTNYDTIATRENTDIRSLRTELFLNSELPDGNWNTHAYFYQSKRGLPDAVVANKFKPIMLGLGQRQNDRNIFLQTSIQKKFNRYHMAVKAKYANDYTYYTDPTIVKLEGPLENHYHQQETYLSLANSYDLTKGWGFALSGDWQWNKLNADLDNFAYPTRNTVLVASATRYKSDRLTLQSSLLVTWVQDGTKYNQAASRKTKMSPAASLSWQPFFQKDFFLRAFYKRIFRMPTFNDLYYTAIGNTLLDPEYAHQFDAGFTFAKTFNQQSGYINLQTDGYYNLVTNKIVATPAANQFRWIMYNLDRVSIKGIDVVLKGGLSLSRDLKLDVGINYSYEDARIKTDATSGMKYNAGEQVPYIPWHSGSFIMQVDYKNFLLNYSFVYTGERYSQAANSSENYLQPWYTHDLAVGKGWLIGHRKMRVMGEVNNIFNQAYEVVKSFPMPGRSYRLTLIFNY
ncbi:TonB-dependent receptor [Olivibacter ginsenosidimutans]|uniref:TonB-dependent receptor n=2 Tax=Olivibacter ginsenosidimutans TaxID=1176537 RepID=A0ABP9AXX2_9SPHI